MIPLRQQVRYLAILVFNNIFSFIVTAGLFICSETLFSQYGDAPTLWFLILPIRTAIFYSLHRHFDRDLRVKSQGDGCQRCAKVSRGSTFSLVVALAFQFIFYEPRWICVFLNMTCTMPQAIILEIPLGFTFLVAADHFRAIRQHNNLYDWLVTHCSPRDMSLQVLGEVLTLSMVLSRYKRIWTLKMDYFKPGIPAGGIVLLFFLVQIEAQFITRIMHHVEKQAASTLTTNSETKPPTQSRRSISKPHRPTSTNNKKLTWLTARLHTVDSEDLSMSSGVHIRKSPVVQEDNKIQC